MTAIVLGIYRDRGFLFYDSLLQGNDGSPAYAGEKAISTQDGIRVAFASDKILKVRDTFRNFLRLSQGQSGQLKKRLEGAQLASIGLGAQFDAIAIRARNGVIEAVVARHDRFEDDWTAAALKKPQLIIAGSGFREPPRQWQEVEEALRTKLLDGSPRCAVELLLSEAITLFQNESMVGPPWVGEVFRLAPSGDTLDWESVS